MSKHNNKKILHKLNTQDTIYIYKRLWSYMAEYWDRFFISILAMTIAAITEPAFARIMKPLIDEGFIDQDHTTIINTPILIVAIFLVRAIASYINDYTTNWLSSSIVEKMRKIMFDHMLKLPIQYYNDHGSGRIISRVVFDVTQITDAGFNAITIVLKDGITIIGLIGLLFYTNWQLTCFCLITLPPILILVKKLSIRLRKLSHYNQKQYGDMTQIINEVIRGQKIVKSFGAELYEQVRFNACVNSIKLNNVKQAATSSINSGLSQFLAACALSTVLYFATSYSKTNGLTAGDFVSFIIAMIMVFAPMKRITNVTQSLQKGLTAAQSVFQFIDTPQEENLGNLKLNGITNSIVFKDVTFQYSTSRFNAVDNLSLEIKHGQTVALVGSSGSGKTTLTHLLSRFYTVTTGSISIDGVNIQKFELSSLRNNIALVSQDILLFNDSVINNIAYSTAVHERDYNAIKEAAKLANALDFIEQLPHGFNTIVGENGVRLSGGQKQRIAIARAIFKNAPILILDEATAALDNHSEKLLQEALDRLMHQRTTLVIAHRLSTILNADKIVVMEKGRIIEIGNHQSLLKLNGAYTNLYKLQLI